MVNLVEMEDWRVLHVALGVLPQRHTHASLPGFEPARGAALEGACGLAVEPGGPEPVLDALRSVLDRGLPAASCGGVSFEPPDGGSAARICRRIYRGLGLVGADSPEATI